jgi:hypothetical protein
MEATNSNKVIRGKIKVVSNIYTLAQNLNALACRCSCDGAVMMHMVWCNAKI